MTVIYLALLDYMLQSSLHLLLARMTAEYNIYYASEITNFWSRDDFVSLKQIKMGQNTKACNDMTLRSPCFWRAPKMLD